MARVWISPPIVVVFALFMSALTVAPNPLNRVAVIGDSITEDGRYVQTLQFLRPDLVFHNFGVSSEGTSEILRRIRPRGSDLKNKIVGISDYRHFIILAGVNNVFDPERVISDLKKLYETVKESSGDRGRVIALTLSPWGGYKTWSSKMQKNTEKINSFIRSRPENVDIVVDINNALADDSRPERMARLYHKPGDYLHPGEKGQEMIGHAIFLAAFNEQLN